MTPRMKETIAKPELIGKVWKEPRDGLSPILWNSLGVDQQLSEGFLWGGHPQLEDLCSTEHLARCGDIVVTSGWWQLKGSS